MLLLARRLCRGLGLTARAAIRRGSPTVAVRFDDGSAVGIRPDIVLLQRRGTARVPMARIFARALARAKRWVISRDDTALPLHRHGGPGTPLAGTQAALRAHMAARLGGLRPAYLADDPELRRNTAALWDKLMQHGPDVDKETGRVLILTPPCLRVLLAAEPGSAKRLAALTTRHPGMTVVAFLSPDGMLRLLSIDRLNGIIRSRLRKTRLASEVDTGCQNDGPGQDFPEPA